MSIRSAFPARGDVRAADGLDQRGYTLIEVIIAMFVIGVAILGLMMGLLTNMKANNVANQQQRTNLALTTFLENMPYVAPSGASCVAVSDPPPSSGTGGSSVPSNAKSLLDRALTSPEVQRWVDRGIVFTVTGVEYAKWTVSGTGTEDFGAACDAAGPAIGQPWFPAIRVSVQACWSGAAGSSSCGSENSVTVRAQVVRRGGRLG